jgi:hypothetical protein
MSNNGFYNEWITVGSNRILLECKNSFPAEDERFIADVAVKVLENNASDLARVVCVYYDDETCTYTVTVASTKAEDCAVEPLLTSVLEDIFNNGSFAVSFELVAPGDEAADDYNHMQHLSVATEIVTKEEIQEVEE